MQSATARRLMQYSYHILLKQYSLTEHVTESWKGCYVHLLSFMALMT